jgi:4-amino-4-deoxy-L-arabinose transferase-like glycosyltransferase
LNWSNPVGPLSGKTGVAVIAFLVAWVVAHFTMKDKEVNLKTYVIVAGVLTALGFLMTFPPFFDLFA